ncbi:MAG: PilZ domain-containing protein [Gemmatimonadales bacterium]
MEAITRLHPRLSFAGRVAPRLETGAASYEILDLSPGGVRFRVSPTSGRPVTIGDILRATIRFPADRSVPVAGRVLRVAGNEAAVCLDGVQDELSGNLPAGPALARRTGLLW